MYEAEELVFGAQSKEWLGVFIKSDAAGAEVTTHPIGAGGQINILNSAENRAYLFNFWYRLSRIPAHANGNNMR